MYCYSSLRHVALVCFVFLSFGTELSVAKRQGSVVSPVPIASNGFGDGLVILEPPSGVPIQGFQRLDIYGELLCPDYRAFKDVEQALVKKYEGSNLMVVLHLFPLPYHHASYVINQCALGLAHSQDSVNQGEALIRFRNAIFDQQESFGNLVLANQTMDDIMEHVGDVAGSVGFSKDDAIAYMVSRDWDVKLRTMLKAAWVLGVTGTPTLILNGAPLYYVPEEDESDDSGWTVDLLSGLIDPNVIWQDNREMANSLGSDSEFYVKGAVSGSQGDPKVNVRSHYSRLESARALGFY